MANLGQSTVNIKAELDPDFHATVDEAKVALDQLRATKPFRVGRLVRALLCGVLAVGGAHLYWLLCVAVWRLT